MCLQLFSDYCRFALHSVSLKLEPKKPAAELLLSIFLLERQRKILQETQLKTFKSDLICGMILPEMNICSADAQEEMKINV